jgi:hypothetical protein
MTKNGISIYYGVVGGYDPALCAADVTMERFYGGWNDAL